MSELVNPSDVEAIVGAKRHHVKHLGNVDTTTEQVFILHSEICRDHQTDLRECEFSKALDRGIDLDDFEGYTDRPIVLGVDERGVLAPAHLAAQRSGAFPSSSEVDRG